METFAKEIDGKFEKIPVHYFDCGDLFTYKR